MKKLLLITSLLLMPVSARAQQTPFVPDCSGTNDTAAFTALISTISSNVGTISLPYKAGTRCAVNNLRVPPNITLDNTQGSGIKVNTGQTLTVTGPISNPPGKALFYNALVGQGTVSLADNTVLGLIFPQWWGAIGNLERNRGRWIDSTKEIQAAMDAAPAGGMLFFPNGIYKISSPLRNVKPLVLRGANMTNQDNGATATQIVGDFDDYLIKFPLAGIVSGVGVEDMYLKNERATAGGGIFVSDAQASTRFKHLYIEAYRAITITKSNFSVLVEDVRLKGIPLTIEGPPRITKVSPGGWGIYTRGHTQIISADIVYFDHGIRAGGAGVSIVGGRFERNNTGIFLGRLDDGILNQAADVSMTGFSMEANDIGIHLYAASSYLISAFSIQGTTGSPSGQSVYGILSETMNGGVIQSGGPGGKFSKAAIRSRGFCTFINFGAENSLGTVWDLQHPQTAVFINSQYQSENGATAISHMTASQLFRSIGAPDRIRGVKPGNNLRGINVPVAAGASFIDVTFPSHRTGEASFQSVVTAMDSSSRLATGVYYYTPTIVNEVGETSATQEKRIEVMAGQRVNFAFYGIKDKYKNWRRRIYRGTASGIYDGYFELPLESSAPFADTGQPFTGKQTPPQGNLQAAAGEEPDAVYAAVVVPSWNAGSVWVTNKTKEGFRVNFSTAPDANATLDWILIR